MDEDDLQEEETDNLTDAFPSSSTWDTHYAEPTFGNIGTSNLRRTSVEIRAHGLFGSLYFTSERRKKIPTSRSDWTKVQGGYELRTGRRIYFTKAFPL